MSTSAENWGVRYRQNSPRGTPLRLDVHGPAARGPAAAGTSLRTTPLFGSGSPPPLPNRQIESRPSSTLLLLPGRTEGSVWSGGSSISSTSSTGNNRRAAGSSPRGDGRVVRFDSVVQLILVPSRRDMRDGLSEELWWSQEDYLQFRLGAIVEGSAGLLRRTLLKKRSSRLQSARADKEAYSPDPKVAQALQRASLQRTYRSGGGAGGSTAPTTSIPRPRQQLKLHALPAYRTPRSIGNLPPTPSPSAAKPPPRAGAEKKGRSPAEVAAAGPKKGDLAPGEGFDGFVSLGGLPEPVASSLEC